MNDTEQKIIKIRQSNPNATGQEIANEVGVTRQYVNEILKKHKLPTKSTLISIHNTPCPECLHTWLRFAKKEDALQRRTCNCLFVLENGDTRVVRHGATYVEISEVKK